MTFNYEKAEVDELICAPIRIKLHDDWGNHTKWLTLDRETFVIVRDAFIAQGEREADARKGLQ